MSLLFLHYLIFSVQIFVGGFFFGFSQLNWTRLFNVNLSIFRVFRNIKLNFFFYFFLSYTAVRNILQWNRLSGSDATVILLQHISYDRHINNTCYCRYSVVLGTKSALKLHLISSSIIDAINYGTHSSLCISAEVHVLWKGRREWSVDRFIRVCGMQSTVVWIIFDILLVTVVMSLEYRVWTLV